MPDTPEVNFHIKKQQMKCLYRLFFSLKELRVQTEDAFGRFRKRKKVNLRKYLLNTPKRPPNLL